VTPVAYSLFDDAAALLRRRKAPEGAAAEAFADRLR
jgi:hypothetical protein